MSSRELNVTKGHGTGNDFVIILDSSNELRLSERDYRWLADRNLGVGADGVIRVVRTDSHDETRAYLDAEPNAEWFMDYLNRDGSKAEICGNGVRVFAEFLVSEGLVDIPAGTALPIVTRGGIVDVTRSAAGFYQIDLGSWSLMGIEPKVATRGSQRPRVGLGVALANQHVVVIVEDHDELSSLDLGTMPELMPPIEGGANIEFVHLAQPLLEDGVGQISMRVYERGVGETLSCGSGAVAAALAARYSLGDEAPNHWKIRVPGGHLAVRMFPTEDREHVSLSGPAKLVFKTSVVLP